MVWLICLLVLIKLGLINNHLLLFILNTTALFSNVLKATVYISLYRNQLKLNKNKCNLFMYILSFVSLSNLI